MRFKQLIATALFAATANAAAVYRPVENKQAVAPTSVVVEGVAPIAAAITTTIAAVVEPTPVILKNATPTVAAAITATNAAVVSEPTQTSTSAIVTAEDGPTGDQNAKLTSASDLPSDTLGPGYLVEMISKLRHALADRVSRPAAQFEPHAHHVAPSEAEKAHSDAISQSPHPHRQYPHPEDTAQIDAAYEEGGIHGGIANSLVRLLAGFLADPPVRLVRRQEDATAVADASSSSDVDEDDSDALSAWPMVDMSALSALEVGLPRQPVIPGETPHIAAAATGAGAVVSAASGSTLVPMSVDSDSVSPHCRLKAQSMADDTPDRPPTKPAAYTCHSRYSILANLIGGCLFG